jgi:hypothetical protein
MLAIWNQRTAEEETLAENRILHLRHNLRLGSRFATILFLQAQRNPFRKIEHRYLAGAGLRWDFVKNEEKDEAGEVERTGIASLGATVMHEAEERVGDTQGTINQARASIFVYTWGAIRERMSVDLAAFFQSVLARPSDFRTSLALDVRVDVVGGTFFIFRYTLVHDTEPPVGVVATDYQLRSGIGIGF